ncbi:ABC transporter substrate-binding protein [Pelagibacterium halotolerans]|uniref:ABC transporter substrate-binding protein n=1 Tax=Pelagibacterium halotolerans TaxID=531813 RepID=UPI00385004B6
MKSLRILAGITAGLIASTAFISSALAFQESPALTELVEAGELPPVEERLPVNPTVIEAVEVGEYGGTWQRAFNGPGDRWGATKLMEERVLKWAPDENGTAQLVPGFIESYSVSEDATEYTFTLLEGLKWSDGHPVTTEDVQFWYEDVFLNKDILPSIDPTFAPGGVPMEIEIVDDRTFTVKFAAPYVYFLQILAKDSTGDPSLDRPSFLFPKHYLSQFNNHYASDEELAQAAADFNVEKWTDLWGSRGAATAWWFNPDLPVITAWKIETPPPADIVTMVRNPYYYAVDQEGNQLPYIDRIEHRLFQDPETLNLMVAQGQIDMQARHIQSANYTFFRENEERGDYHIDAGLSANVWSLVPNLNTEDAVLGELFADAAFREALSFSIDRELINELAFSGLAEPRAASPISGSPYFREELEEHWVEYDPDYANELLDGIGLTERDSAGFRLRPDGERLVLVVEANDVSHSDTLELLADNLSDVGIELLPRIIDRTQWDANRENNSFQVQWMPFDRLTYVPADPRRMMGSDSYANQYFLWYETDGASGIEPPADHPIRQIFAAWDRASQASTIEDADMAVNELIGNFVMGGYVVGVVGEEPVINIVANDFHNHREGLAEDDIFRGIGFSQPQQFWMEQN